MWGLCVRMETWREDALPGHTHDPNEVTVQIDGLGRKLADLSADPGRGAAAEGPVFVDETGRRSRRFRRFGMVVGVVCAVYAAVIVGTLFSGSSSAPWLPMPEPKAEKPASKVDTPGGPAAALDPSASTDSSPSPGASDDGTDKPGGPGDGDGVDGGSDPSRTDASGDRPGTNPGSGTTKGGDPDPGTDRTGGDGTAVDPTAGSGNADPAPPDPVDPPVDTPVDPPTQPSQPAGNGGSGGDGGGNGGGGGGGGSAEVPVGYTPSAGEPSAEAVRS